MSSRVAAPWDGLRVRINSAARAVDSIACIDRRLHDKRSVAPLHGSRDDRQERFRLKEEQIRVAGVFGVSEVSLAEPRQPALSPSEQGLPGLPEGRYGTA